VRRPLNTWLSRLAVGTLTGFGTTALLTIGSGLFLDNFASATQENLWFLFFPVFALLILIPTIALRLGRTSPIRGWGVFLGTALAIGAVAIIISYPNREALSRRTSGSSRPLGLRRVAAEPPDRYTDA
jgi:hypothetical protein